MKYVFMNVAVAAINTYLAIANHVWWNGMAAGVSLATALFMFEVSRFRKEN